MADQHSNSQKPLLSIPPNANLNRQEQLATELREITALYNIGVAVSSSLSLREVLWTVYKESSRLIKTDNFAIIIADQETDTLNFTLIFDAGQKKKPFAVRLTKHSGPIQRILAQQAPILANNVTATDNTHKLVEIERLRANKPIQSWLGVPITNPVNVGETVQGTIVIWSDSAGAFGEHDLWLLSAIGNQAAIAIRNARLYESSQRQAAETAFLNQVARTLSSILDLDEVLHRILEEVDSMLNVEAGSLLLVDHQTGELVFRTALGSKGDEVKPFRVPRGQGFAGEVALTGKPLIIADVSGDSRHFSNVDDEIGFKTHNMLCVPLVLHHQVIGVIQVMNKRVGNFNQHDLELLSAIASYAAIAIENARLLENVLDERDRVIEAEEKARRELARDLHDGPVQLVAGMRMKLDFSQKAVERNRMNLVIEELGEMIELADRATHQMRTMLFQLRPLALETQGLGAALQVFIERRQKDTGLPPKAAKLVLDIQTTDPGGDLSRQDDKVEAAIFAIVQEAVNNAIKHAKANTITVKLSENNQAVTVAIIDDGTGFDVDKVMDNYDNRGSLGMINLKERTEAVGGDLMIKSRPGEGTQITIHIPKEEALRRKKRATTGTLTLPKNIPPTPSSS